MAQEMVMVLDDNGNPMGKKLPRHEAHNKQLWHETVHIWIVNEKRELLIQKRSADKRQYANVWHVSTAGHISAEETPMVTALREVEEELGLKIFERDLILIHRLKVMQVVPETKLQDKEWLCVYLVRINSNSGFNLQEEEVKEVRWISLHKLESDIRDPVKVKNYLNHPSSYYLETIDKIRQLIK